MNMPASRSTLLAVAMFASAAYSITSAAKTITLSCPVRSSSDPITYYIDLDAHTVSATLGGSKFMDGNDATITDTSISFIYEANLGNRGICRDKIVIDRHTAAATSTPVDPDGCGDQYWSAQCTLMPDNSF